VQQALEDQVAEWRLAELVTPTDRQQALPSLLQEVAEGDVGVRHGPGPVVVEQPGHTGDAPSPLARAHAQTHVAADVVDGAGADLDDRPDHVGAGRQLALADQVAVGLLFLYPGEALSEPV